MRKKQPKTRKPAKKQRKHRAAPPKPAKQPLNGAYADLLLQSILMIGTGKQKHS
jgi:hypothetical protein